jgi:hypothetical protein
LSKVTVLSQSGWRPASGPAATIEIAPCLLGASNNFLLKDANRRKLALELVQNSRAGQQLVTFDSYQLGPLEPRSENLSSYIGCPI